MGAIAPLMQIIIFWKLRMNKADKNIYKLNAYCGICRLILSLLFLSLGLSLYLNGSNDAKFWASASILIGLIFCFIYIKNFNKNHFYVVDSINDKLHKPIQGEAVCNLSDIIDLNKRSSQRKERVSFYENGKQKFRTNTVVTYYLDIVTHDGVITETLDKSTRDALHSLISRGLKDINTN